MLAATWPTSWRSTPVTVMCVCLSIAMSMPGGDVEHHRVRVAEREDHLLALHLGAVADADDVELALEAVGDAGDRVGHQAARQAVELAELRVVGVEPGHQLTVGELEHDAGGMRLAQLALRTLDLDGAVDHLDGDALGHRDGFLTDSRHICYSPSSSLNWQLSWVRVEVEAAYQMLQSTSPPTPALTAARPVITPREVVRMLVPSPASTSGTSSRPK